METSNSEFDQEWDQKVTRPLHRISESSANPATRETALRVINMTSASPATDAA